MSLLLCGLCRFQLHDTSFCFTNSHLAAHQTEIAARNDDFKEIAAGIRIGTFAHMRARAHARA